jgi:disulfide bond formation protein DsbB
MDRLSYWLERSSLHIALLAAWTAMLGSLYFSEVAHYLPCTLCWYQRILMYPLTLILAIGLLRRDEHTPLLVLPFSLLGIGVSTYHVLLEKTDWFSAAATCQAGIPCTVLWINWFGFITIPFLALIAFLTITVMAIVARQAGEPVAEEDEPGRAWPSVIAVIAAVSLAFAGLTAITGTSAAADAPFTPITAQNSMTQLDGTPISVDNTAAVTAGQQLYLESCAACHGQDGGGAANLGNSLIASALVQKGADADILTMIRSGRDVNAPDNQSGLVMPPSGGRPDLSDADLLAIIEFLRTEN